MMFQPVDKKRKEISEEGDQTKLIANASNSQNLKAGVEGEESPRKDIRAQTGKENLELHSMWLLLLSVNWCEETCESAHWKGF